MRLIITFSERRDNHTGFYANRYTLNYNSVRIDFKKIKINYILYNALNHRVYLDDGKNQPTPPFGCHTTQ